MSRYLSNLSDATSVLLNVALGGEPNQTFAARMWQRKKNSKFNIVIILDLIFGRDHCAKQWAYWIISKY